MSNRRRARRGNRLSPEGRLPVGAYTAKELHQFLVEDGVMRHATSLRWAAEAYMRIARLERIPAEEAFQRVRGEVMALGFRGLPTEYLPY